MSTQFIGSHGARVRSIIRYLFHRNDPPQFDIEKAVGKYLLEMHRCSGRIVVASSKYDSEHYFGEVIVNAEDILPWAEEHSNSCWSSRKDEQAARKALPIWVRGADPKDMSATYPPRPFVAVLHPYTLDFILQGIAEVICNECGATSSDVSRMRLNQRSVGRSWRMWTDEWRCHQGHLIYRQDQELHIYFGHPNSP
jgi:hypothetical protein